MSNITVVNQHLPETIEDISRFVLVGREKLVSVRAEIRAIEKLNIAEEVRVQKREEAQMLSEALLDAEVRIGELLKQLPKDPGGRPSNKTMDSAVHSFEDRQKDTAVHNQRPRDSDVPRLEVIKNGSAAVFDKPKSEAVRELGFTEKQKQRFETLAANKDIVEQVKAEARENEDIPTRSRVLQLVKEKNKPQSKDEVDFRYRATRAINEAISNACLVKVDRERLQCWAESLTVEGEFDFQLQMINDAIENLRVIKAFLTKARCE
jgi:hypothetical protein